MKIISTKLLILSLFLALCSSAMSDEISGTIQQIQGSRVEIIIDDSNNKWVSLPENADDNWIGHVLTGDGQYVGDTFLLETFSIK